MAVFLGALFQSSTVYLSSKTPLQYCVPPCPPGMGDIVLKVLEEEALFQDQLCVLVSASHGHSGRKEGGEKEGSSQQLDQ